MLPYVTVEGRVVDDPELRFAPSGTAVGNMRIVAASRKKNESTGEWEDDRLLWLSVTTFRRLAENVAESMRKGDLVIVSGRLQTEEWEERETGQKRSKVVLIADTAARSVALHPIPHHADRSSSSNVERVTTPDTSDPWAAPATSGSDEPPF